MTIESSKASSRDERFRATFEHAAIGMAHVDPQGRWLDANRQLCELLGYSPEELTSLTLRDLTHPDDLDADLACLRRVLSDDIRAYSLQKRYVRKDGSPVWIELTSSLVRDGFGKPEYLIKIVRRLAARAETEHPGVRSVLSDAPDLRATPVRPALRNRGSARAGSTGGAELATPFGVAHDLNDLLFVVLSYAELAMNALPHASPVGQDLREIQRAALRAHELTKYLVALR